MQTKNIIQSNVNVIRIVNLRVGDIYKRFDDSSYSSSVSFGIVKAISNNGENTFIEAVEYKKSYSSVEADFKVFGGEKDLTIFPATLDNIKEEFGGVVEKLKKEIIEKQKEIDNKQKCIEETNSLLSGEMTKELRTAEYRELSQGEYNQLKLDKANALGEL